MLIRMFVGVLFIAAVVSVVLIVNAIRSRTRSEYYSNGKLKCKFTVQKQDGKYLADGTFATWWPSGTNRIAAFCRNSPVGAVDDQGYPNSAFIFHGPFTEWYENGVKDGEGQYDNGKKTGLWTYWRQNGRKAYEGQYVKGIEDGNWVRWDVNGKNLGTNLYRHGAIVLFKWEPDVETVGPFKGKGISGSNKVQQVVERYDTGEIKISGCFVENERHGRLTVWHRNGVIKEWREYYHGVSVGKWNYWDEKGKCLAEGVYKGGKPWSGTFRAIPEDENCTNVLKFTAGRQDAGIK